MPRQARLDTPGTLHHVIIRGIEKGDIVDGTKDREDFVSRMGGIAKDTDTSIYAWSLLTNHAHILLRSGNFGLSRCMRRLLTGYAVSYNNRHRRHGHLFQNRYKSIVCEEETYFLELVRYIHLNPLRAGLVKSLAGLDRYRWSGHSVLMGNHSNEWQSRDAVLDRFGATEKAARAAYRLFVGEGVGQGRRPELVGGGLIRSLGGWSEVKSLRKLGIRELGDDRILGSGEFVERVLDEAEGMIKTRLSPQRRPSEILKIVSTICKEAGVNINELRSGSRRQPVSTARLQIARKLVEEHGVSLAETARQLGVSTSAISLSLRRASQR
jgi:REP element-mobilizing transposase RayT